MRGGKWVGVGGTYGMNDQADSCPALFANSGNQNTVHAIGGRRVQRCSGGGPLDKSKKCRAPCELGVFCVQCGFRGTFDSGYGTVWITTNS